MNGQHASAGRHLSHLPALCFVSTCGGAVHLSLATGQVSGAPSPAFKLNPFAHPPSTLSTPPSTPPPCPPRSASPRRSTLWETGRATATPRRSGTSSCRRRWTPSARAQSKSRWTRPVPEEGRRHGRRRRFPPIVGQRGVPFDRACGARRAALRLLRQVCRNFVGMGGVYAAQAWMREGKNIGKIFATIDPAMAVMQARI